MWNDIHRRLRGKGDPIPLAALPDLMRAIREKELLSPEEVALLYDQEIQTLAQMRSQKRGPAYVKDGKSVFYRREVINDYFSSREVLTHDGRI